MLSIWDDWTTYATLLTRRSWFVRVYTICSFSSLPRRQSGVDFVACREDFACSQDAFVQTSRRRNRAAATRSAEPPPLLIARGCSTEKGRRIARGFRSPPWSRVFSPSLPPIVSSSPLTSRLGSRSHPFFKCLRVFMSFITERKSFLPDWVRTLLPDGSGNSIAKYVFYRAWRHGGRRSLLSSTTMNTGDRASTCLPASFLRKCTPSRITSSVTGTACKKPLVLPRARGTAPRFICLSCAQS